MALSCKAVAQLALNRVKNQNYDDRSGKMQMDMEQRVEDAYDYGRNFGIAFQLMDDYLDFVVDAQQMGKPTAADLRYSNVYQFNSKIT